MTLEARPAMVSRPVLWIEQLSVLLIFQTIFQWIVLVLQVPYSPRMLMQEFFPPVGVPVRVLVKTSPIRHSAIVVLLHVLQGPGQLRTGCQIRQHAAHGFGVKSRATCDIDPSERPT